MNRILGYFIELFGLGLVKRTWHYTHDTPYCLHIIDFWDDLGCSPIDAHYVVTPSGKTFYKANPRLDPYLPRPLLLDGDVDSWDGTSYGYPYIPHKNPGAGIK